jgi:hypothetical protein
MEIKKTVEVPATTKVVTEKVVCDLCAATIPREGNYEVNEVAVSHKTGSSYPEGGSGDILKFDLCPACFNEKLVPWLRSQGVTRQSEEWGW